MPRLPVAELEKLMEPVVAHHDGAREIRSAFFSVLREQLRFPFPAKIVGLGKPYDGLDVIVEGIVSGEVPLLRPSSVIFAIVRRDGPTQRVPLDVLELKERPPGADWIDAWVHFLRHGQYRSRYRAGEPEHYHTHECVDGRSEEGAWCIGELMNWWEEDRDPRRLPGCVSRPIAGFLYRLWRVLGPPEAERRIVPLVAQLPGTRRSGEWELERRLLRMTLAWASGPQELAWVRLNESGRFQEELDKLPLQGLGELDSLPSQRAWSVTHPPSGRLGTDASLRIGASAAKREARRAGEAARHLPTRQLRQEATDRARRCSAFATMQYCAYRGTSTAIVACLDRAAAHAPQYAASFAVDGHTPGCEAISPACQTHEEAGVSYASVSTKRRREPARMEAAVAWGQFCEVEGWPKVRDQAYALASLAARVATIDEVRNGRRKRAGVLAEATAIRVTTEFLDPAVLEIQGSALELVPQMIRVAKEEASPRTAKHRPVGPDPADSAEPFSSGRSRKD